MQLEDLGQKINYRKSQPTISLEWKLGGRG